MIQSSFSLPFVPREGIEPSLLAKYDFESYASTNSATEASTIESVAEN